MKFTQRVKTTTINVKFLHWNNNRLDEICSRMIVQENNRSNCCHGSRSGVRGRMSLRSMVKSDGDIQPALAVVLPSAQTFINITSQPGQRHLPQTWTAQESAWIKINKLAHFHCSCSILIRHRFSAHMNSTLLTWRGFQLQPGIIKLG